MGTSTDAICRLRADEPDEPSSIPTPARIRATAAEIRSAWSPGERRRRAQAARCVLLRQLCGAASLMPADRAPRLRLLPSAFPDRW